MKTDFDIIVIGSGCAGAVAACVAARTGKSVLVVERGNYAGEKNMTGGRIYSHSLKKVFPNFEATAPLERKITHERLALLDSVGQTAIDFTSAQLSAKGKDSYSVLRAPFDQWLAGQAELTGAEYIYGIVVEKLIKDKSGKVMGVSARGDDITAQVVIVADGVNSLISERCLGNPRPKPHQVAVGIKEVFELSPETISDRFLTKEDEGAAMLFVGDCTKGAVGGGFLYTNKSSISFGLVANISLMENQDTPIYQMLEDFKNHPAVAPILKSAKMLEHSGHMVPEGGYDMIPRYVFDGALIAGEAAGLCMNKGYQVRGMDFAIASGQFAAEAALSAIQTGNTSAEGLASYQAKMESSFVIQDMKTFKHWPSTMGQWSRMFTQYPRMVTEMGNVLFSVDGAPQKHLSKRMMPLIKQRGILSLMKEARGALKSL